MALNTRVWLARGYNGAESDAAALVVGRRQRFLSNLMVGVMHFTVV